MTTCVDDPSGALVLLPAEFWDVTPRWAVRRTLPDGTASDVVGHVLSADADCLLLLPQDGPPVRIGAATIVARREVPARAVRPASSPDAVELLASRGWPGLACWRLGGWLLRAGDGYSNRANSCLVAGDPGVPVERALEVVAAHYARLGLPARLQLAHRAGQAPDDAAHALERLLDAAGWAPYSPTTVLVTDLRRGVDDLRRGVDDLRRGVDDLRRGVTDLRRGVDDRPDDVFSTVRDSHGADALSTSWASAPDDGWLRVRHGGRDAGEAAAAPVLTAVAAEYLTIRDGAGAPLAIGRLVRTDDWVGLSCVEVEPGHRGRGLGRLATVTMLDRARGSGLGSPARFAYLQVERDNPVAHGLYRSLGFTEHHDYHYRQAPG